MKAYPTIRMPTDDDMFYSLFPTAQLQRAGLCCRSLIRQLFGMGDEVTGVFDNEVVP